MALLHNRISQKELKELLYQETEPRTTISFYQYFFIDDPGKFRDELYKGLKTLSVFGRIYVAHEGINAQLSVPQSHFEAMKDYLYSIGPLSGVRLNIAIDDDGKSFWVLKIKVRNKIVADGITDTSFSMTNKGKYVDAPRMNELMNDADTVIIDMRNHYEYEVGHFENALEIPSETLKQQLPMAVDMMEENRETNIVMYCTGGIRCEKASAVMLHNGFYNVLHLDDRRITYA